MLTVESPPNDAAPGEYNPPPPPPDPPPPIRDTTQVGSIKKHSDEHDEEHDERVPESELANFEKVSKDSNDDVCSSLLLFPSLTVISYIALLGPNDLLPPYRSV
jgi:hypothetical protein